MFGINLTFINVEFFLRVVPIRNCGYSAMASMRLQIKQSLASSKIHKYFTRSPTARLKGRLKPNLSFQTTFFYFLNSSLMMSSQALSAGVGRWCFFHAIVSCQRISGSVSGTAAKVSGLILRA